VRRTNNSTLSRASMRAGASRAMSLGTVFGALLLAASPPPVAAQPVAAQPEQTEPAPDSPRAAVQEYLSLCGKGDYASAARYLVLRPSERERGAELARRLRGVLDQRLWIDLEALSPSSTGDESDNLPRGIDQIGTILTQGRQAPVRLVATMAGDSASWAFSPETVARIDRWYAALSDRWFRERLPDALLRPGPLDLAWWQWLALPMLAFASWIIS